MKNLGITLVFLGALVTLIGALLYAGVGLSWVGRLPGDIRIVKPGFSIYLPITTCIVLSAFVSAVLFIIRMSR